MNAPESACQCGFLNAAAADPRLPIRHDTRLNEYYICFASGLGRVWIQFCPRCGGRAPESHRASLFAAISGGEKARLQAMFGQMETLKDVLSAWGEPDADFNEGDYVESPLTRGTPQHRQTFRSLVYRHVSDVAVVRVRVHPDERVTFGFHAKQLREAQEE